MKNRRSSDRLFNTALAVARATEDAQKEIDHLRAINTELVAALEAAGPRMCGNCQDAAENHGCCPGHCAEIVHLDAALEAARGDQ